MGNLARPALNFEQMPTPAPSAPAVGIVSSYLGVPITLRGVVMEVEAPAVGKTVTYSGEYMRIPVPGERGRELVYMEVDVPKGVPGKSATEAGSPTRTRTSTVPNR